jgi:hypothetical protein
MNRRQRRASAFGHPAAQAPAKPPQQRRKPKATRRHIHPPPFAAYAPPTPPTASKAYAPATASWPVTDWLLDVVLRRLDVVFRLVVYLLVEALFAVGRWLLSLGHYWPRAAPGGMRGI